MKCSKLFDPGFDPDYFGLLSKHRLNYSTDDVNITTDCETIKERNYFPTKPQSKFEEDFPIAYARIVYKVRERFIAGLGL